MTVHARQAWQPGNIPEGPSSWWSGRVIGVLLAFIALILWYKHIANLYPYYVNWDMDHSTSLDLMLLFDHHLPGHFAHTGFGMYLLLHFSHLLSWLSGLVTIGGMNDLKQSLNPMMGVAQLNDYIRFNTPFFAGIMVIFLWSAIYKVQRHGIWAALAIILLLGTQKLFWFHVYMVRSEFYSVFFWSMALFMAAFSACATTEKKQLAGLFGAGVFIGLCFTTKVQSGFYILSIPMLYLLFCLFRQSAQERTTLQFLSQSVTSPIHRKAAVTSLSLFIILSIGAGLIRPHHIAHFRESFGITGLWLAAMLGFVLVLVMQLIGERRLAGDSTNGGQVRMHLQQINCCAIWLGFGFVASFFLHYLFYGGNVILASKHMLLTFKVIFFGHILQAVLKAVVSHRFERFLTNLQHLSVIYSAFFTVLIIANVAWCRAKHKIFILLLLNTLGVIILLNLYFVVRDVKSADIIWAQMLVTVLGVIIALAMIRQIKRYKRTCAVLLTGLLSLLVINNFVYQSPPNVQYKESKYLHGVYRAHNDYSIIMCGYYGDEGKGIVQIEDNPVAQAALKQAVNYRYQNNILRQMLPYSSINISNIGLVEKGFRAWISDANQLIDGYSKRLRHAMLVDISTAMSGDVNVTLPSILRHIKATNAIHQDVDAFLFIQDSQYSTLASAFPKALSHDPLIIATTSRLDGQKRLFKGIAVQQDMPDALSEQLSSSAAKQTLLVLLRDPR